MQIRTFPLAALALAIAGGAAHAADAKVERRITADLRGTVVVSNVAGRIAVVGWERAEVEVTGTIGRGVERVDVQESGKRTTVKVVLRKGVRLGGADANLTVRVPKHSALEVSTVSADVSSREVLGTQRLTTVSGDVSAMPGGTELQVKTVSGDVDVTGRGSPAAVRVKTVSGDLTYQKGAGSLEVETVSGDAQATLDPASSLRASTTSGNVELKGTLAADARIDVQTMSGDLSVSTRAPAGMSAEVETFSGDLRSCFGAKIEQVSGHGPGERLSTVVGEGKAQIRLKSFSGDVRLCDR